MNYLILCLHLNAAERGMETRNKALIRGILTTFMPMIDRNPYFPPARDNLKGMPRS